MEFSFHRQCVVLQRGDVFPVVVDDALKASGWLGGQAVMWTDHPEDQLRVTHSTGLYGGFLLAGSDEPSDILLACTGTALDTGTVVLCMGGWIIATTTFEKYTWASRQGPGPLVEIPYKAGQPLLFSLRGYWTVEDEWALSGDPRAPNGYYIGGVIKPPSRNTQGYLLLQTRI